MAKCAIFTVLLTGSGPLVVALPSRYEFVESYKGWDFFDKFNFFSGEDPSKGAARYVGRREAEALGLVEADERSVLIRADRHSVLPADGKRASVRIESKAVFNDGLFIARVKHAPTGCGQWPALWLYGETLLHPWPEWGEYDILEGVHRQTHARTTLHTAEGCSQSDIFAGRDFSGKWEQAGVNKDGTDNEEANDCYINADGQFENQGCSQRGPDESLGPVFNANGGGTYAAEWDRRGGRIRTWFWPAGGEPPDLTSGVGPYPEEWGTPYSYFSLGAQCDPNHLKNMRLVLNINFCGDLAEGTWEDSCPGEAALGTCREFVQQNPEALETAYWSIGSIDIFRLVEDWQGDGRMPPQQPVAFAWEAQEEADPFWQHFPILVGVTVALCGIIGCVAVMLAEMNRQHEAARLSEEDEAAMIAHQQMMEMMRSADDPTVNCSLTSNNLYRVLARWFGRRDACPGSESPDLVPNVASQQPLPAAQTWVLENGVRKLMRHP